MRTSILIVLFFVTFVWGQDPNQTISELKVKIEKLEQKIAEQDATIEAQRKEISRLNNVSRKSAQLKSPPKSKNGEDNYILYNGKWRSRHWFNTMYENCGARLIYDNERYVDITPYLLIGKINFAAALPEGSIIRLEDGFTVLSVLSDNEIIIHNSQSEVTLHINNCTRKYVDGEIFSSNQLLKATGTYQYDANISRKGAPTGGKATTSSLMPFDTVSQEQFVDALNEGIPLKLLQKRSDGKITFLEIK
jgi:hypothetical protein